MTISSLSPGVVHEVPTDMSEAIEANPDVVRLWNGLTPLARNEWICWVISVKNPETRKQHIDRLCNDLVLGKRRPCCWAGCRHR